MVENCLPILDQHNASQLINAGTDNDIIDFMQQLLLFALNISIAKILFSEI